MATTKPVRESDLYPRVEKWMRSTLSCFATGINTGTRHGRIDVAGLRDVGGDLSGKCELIAIEVKAGRQPFATAAGQAYGYSVYADLTYLADLRPAGKDFSDAERAIAARLKIGLIALRGNGRIAEVQTSPLHEPIEGLRLQVIEAMGHAVCSVCSAVFRRGEDGREFANVKRAGVNPGAVKKAVAEGKGYVYWLQEASGRDKKQRSLMYRRRYVCPDCVWNLFRDFAPDAE